MKAWILAKPSSDILEWYEYDLSYDAQDDPTYTLSKTLRLSQVVKHASKESAKHAAIKLKLKSWQYVVLN